jgi:hypothetical protein
MIIIDVFGDDSSEEETLITTMSENIKVEKQDEWEEYVKRSPALQVIPFTET